MTPHLCLLGFQFCNAGLKFLYLKLDLRKLLLLLFERSVQLRNLTVEGGLSCA